MEEMPPFRPVKAFLATLPMALNPSLKEPSFAFAASVAMSVSLICPVNTPKAEVSLGNWLIAIVVTLYNKCEWFREKVDAIIEAVNGQYPKGRGQFG